MKRKRPITKKLARVAETSSIERLSKIKVFASIEIYGKNATLANFQNVTVHCKKDKTDDRMTKVFLLHKDKEKGNPPHIQAHLSLPDTQRPMLRKAKRAFILPTHRQTVDYSNTFYIEKRDIENYLLFLWLNYSDKMNRIKEVLEEKGIKQTWLADKLGKSYNMVNGYVQNRQQPRLEILYEIAEILEVSVKELLVEKNKDAE